MFARLYEKQHHIVCEGVYYDYREYEIHCRYLYCRPYSEPYPLDFLRPYVLSAVGCHGHADVLEHTGKEVFGTHRRGERCHIGRSKRIVGALQHYYAYCRYRELHAHRYAVHQQAACLLVVIRPLAARRYEYAQVFPYVCQAQRRGENLCRHRGYSCAFNAHAEAYYQYEVERNVEQRCRYKEVERLF